MEAVKSLNDSNTMLSLRECILVNVFPNSEHEGTISFIGTLGEDVGSS